MRTKSLSLAMRKSVVYGVVQGYMRVNRPGNPIAAFSAQGDHHAIQ